MGTKQLLFIALGVIIASIAAVAGMQFFAANAVQSNRDAVILDLQRLAGKAQAYYKQGAVSGGGGKSFVGFKIPPTLKKNDNGTYTILYAQEKRMLISGVGVENAENGLSCGGNKVKITYQIIIRPHNYKIRKRF